MKEHIWDRGSTAPESGSSGLVLKFFQRSSHPNPHILQVRIKKLRDFPSSYGYVQNLLRKISVPKVKADGQNLFSKKLL